MPQPTVFPADNFNPYKAAKDLHDAMKGLGTKTEEIIDVLCSHDNEQRQKIKIAFQSKYDKTLHHELDKELAISGDFKQVIDGLLAEPPVFAARELRRAMKGLGTHEHTLIEILCSHDSRELAAIKSAYQKEFKRDLMSDLHNDTSGKFRMLLENEALGRRDQSTEVDHKAAEKDARYINKAGKEKAFMDDNAKLVEIFATRSYTQITGIGQCFQSLYGIDLLSFIGNNTIGDAGKAYEAIVQYAMDPDVFFAIALHKALKGMGTDDDCLIRIIIMRSEVDLGDIQREFKKKYGALGKWIKKDTSFDFRKILERLIF